MKKILIYSLMLAATILLAASTSCISSQSPIPVKGVGDRSIKLMTFPVSRVLMFPGVSMLTLYRGTAKVLFYLLRKTCLNILELRYRSRGKVVDADEKAVMGRIGSD